MYVLPEWVELNPVAVIGAWEDGYLTTAVVARELAHDHPFIPYQGMLLSRRANARVETELIKWLEGMGGMMSVWSSPAYVDVRQFQNRAPDAVWIDRINYTTLYERRTQADEVQTVIEPVEKTDEVIERFGQASPAKELKDVLRLDSVSLWGHNDSLVAWGVDLQDRGYLIAGLGDYHPIVAELIGQHPTSELGPPEHWKYQLGARLRTSYGMVRIR